MAGFEYMPYGDPLSSAGVPSCMGYTGMWQSCNSSNSHFPLREYDPDIARWTTRDPLGMADGPNMHAYVDGNPSSMVDPTGGMAVWVATGIWGAISGGAFGAWDQAGCGWGSIAAGAGLGAASGAAAGVIATAGLTAGILGGAGAGFIDGWIRGGFDISSGMSGAAFGGFSGLAGGVAGHRGAMFREGLPANPGNVVAGAIAGIYISGVAPQWPPTVNRHCMFSF